MIHIALDNIMDMANSTYIMLYKSFIQHNVKHVYCIIPINNINIELFHNLTNMNQIVYNTFNRCYCIPTNTDYFHFFISNNSNIRQAFKIILYTFFFARIQYKIMYLIIF